MTCGTNQPDTLSASRWIGTRLNCASRDVREIVARHLMKLDGRIAALQGMADVLRHLVLACRGDGRPDCPILDDFSDREIHDVLRWSKPPI